MRLPCVGISRTKKRKINASNNWNWWRFEVHAISSLRLCRMFLTFIIIPFVQVKRVAALMDAGWPDGFMVLAGLSRACPIPFNFFQRPSLGFRD
jgi:hypothetical protein